jgi:hypothetical protein
MTTLIWAALIVNALVHLRLSILRVQDGQDRVDAGLAEPNKTACWQQWGKVDVALDVLFSPIVTAYKGTKFLLKVLLFPRGIKSKFAKWQEAEAARELLEKQVQDAEVFVHTWVPGEILFAKNQPEQQVALAWDHAADVFDTACDLVARTKGQPWQTNFDQVIKARVGT